MNVLGMLALASMVLVANVREGLCEGIYYTGSLLLKYCSSETEQMSAQQLVDYGFCEGFISAVLGASRCGENIYGHSSLIPDGVTVDDLKILVVKWLAQHPEKLQLAAEGLVAESLNDSYPCN